MTATSREQGAALGALLREAWKPLIALRDEHLEVLDNAFDDLDSVLRILEDEEPYGDEPDEEETPHA